MTNEEIQKLVRSWFPSQNLSEPVVEENVEGEEKKPVVQTKELVDFSEEGSQFLNISVTPELLHELMQKLKDDPATKFDLLFCLTGMDWGKELGVVYHLESTTHRHMIVVKVQTADREDPNFDTVSDLWPTADFHEREVFDFFGINFNNHPNMKYLFLTEDWEGYPLRKDYVDEKNMIIY